MTTVDVLDPAGKKSGSVDLPAEVFDVQVNVPLDFDDLNPKTCLEGRARGLGATNPRRRDGRSR